MRPRLAVTIALLSCAWIVGAQPKPPADAWLAEHPIYPAGQGSSPSSPEVFQSLSAEVVAEQLKVRWPASAWPATARVLLHYSADAPGHWPARDWRAVPMPRRGEAWEATLPVDDLDVPLVYFVSDASASPVRCSPMRVVSPRRAGMEKPSRVFWPFLDGFEDGVAGWQLVTTEAPALRTSPHAHDGNAALVVTLPTGKQMISVSTPRVRGWHYSLQLATGVRVWLRAPGGAGEARFALHAHAGTTNALVVGSTVTAALSDKWQRVDLSFGSFPNFPAASTDLFTIEFRGEGPREFLVDDLQLLGRWKLPGD